MWIEPMRLTTSGSLQSGPPSLNIGTRETLSTPPATARSRSPPRIRPAVWPTASTPEAQNRFSVTPGTWSPQPASSTDVRATFAPWSPTWAALPTTTSSTRDGSIPVRPASDCSRCTSRFTGVTPCSEPLREPLARGVRTKSKTYTSGAVLTPSVVVPAPTNHKSYQRLSYSRTPFVSVLCRPGSLTDQLCLL